MSCFFLAILEALSHSATMNTPIGIMVGATSLRKKDAAITSRIESARSIPVKMAQTLSLDNQSSPIP